MWIFMRSWPKHMHYFNRPMKWVFLDFVVTSETIRNRILLSYHAEQTQWWKLDTWTFNKRRAHPCLQPREMKVDCPKRLTCNLIVFKAFLIRNVRLESQQLLLGRCRSHHFIHYSRPSWFVPQLNYVFFLYLPSHSCMLLCTIQTKWEGTLKPPSCNILDKLHLPRA